MVNTTKIGIMKDIRNYLQDVYGVTGGLREAANLAGSVMASIPESEPEWPKVGERFRTNDIAIKFIRENGIWVVIQVTNREAGESPLITCVHVRTGKIDNFCGYHFVNSQFGNKSFDKL